MDKYNFFKAEEGSFHSPSNSEFYIGDAGTVTMEGSEENEKNTPSLTDQIQWSVMLTVMKLE